MHAHIKSLKHNRLTEYFIYLSVCAYSNKQSSYTLFNILFSKPEPNMLNILPIIPSSTSQKIYLLFYSHIITCFYFIHFVLLFCVLTSRETWV